MHHRQYSLWHQFYIMALAFYALCVIQHARRSYAKILVILWSEERRVVEGVGVCPLRKMFDPDCLFCEVFLYLAMFA